MIAHIKSETAMAEREAAARRLAELDELLFHAHASLEASRKSAPLWREWTALLRKVRACDISLRQAAPPYPSRHKSPADLPPR